MSQIDKDWQIADLQVKLKDTRKQLAEAREAFRLVNLENQLLNEEVNRLNENINERQLAKYKNVVENVCLMCNSFYNAGVTAGDPKTSYDKSKRDLKELEEELERLKEEVE